MSNPIEQVERELVEVIFKAVPGIMELKEGCRYQNVRFGYVCTIIGMSDGDILHTWNETEQRVGGELREHFDVEGRMEVLGRPITLEDVLRALSKAMMYPEISFGLNDKLNFKIWETFDRKNLAALCEWNLGKPLSEQSNETKLFLHSLLTK